IDANERMLPPATRKASKRHLNTYSRNPPSSCQINTVTEDGGFDPSNKSSSKLINSAEGKRRLQKSFDKLNALLDDSDCTTPSRITRIPGKRSAGDLKSTAIPYNAQGKHGPSTTTEFRSPGGTPLRKL